MNNSVVEKIMKFKYLGIYITNQSDHNIEIQHQNIKALQMTDVILQIQCLETSLFRRREN